MESKQFRFKGVEFRCNPRSFQIKQERRLVRLYSPISGSIVQELGTLPREISGEGLLWGENAQADYHALSELFQSNGSGLLLIPGHPPIRSYFRSLGMLRKAGPELLSYSFSFTESPTA